MARVSSSNMIFFQNTLLSWFEKNRREFPWRKTNLTDYQIVIAEILLQRTKAETVSTFYSSFIIDFPNWSSLAITDTIKIESYLKPIGLYRQRALRLKNLAIEMQKRKGKLPQDRKELESLPFLGQYIVNSIELLVFNKSSPLIDVNMSRLLERYFHKRKMADIRYDPYLQKLSRKLVDNPRAKELNWAVLDYAALICKARNPLCNICELKFSCTYFKAQKKP